jgi:hypothetical protein
MIGYDISIAVESGNLARAGWCQIRHAAPMFPAQRVLFRPA